MTREVADPLRQDGSGHPQSQVVHSLHQTQQVLCPVLVLWFLPRLFEKRGRERERERGPHVLWSCVCGQTWLSSSDGLILEKRLKSMIVICLAISSGSKSNTLSTADGVSGNWRTTHCQDVYRVRAGSVYLDWRQGLSECLQVSLLNNSLHTKKQVPAPGLH